MERAGASEIVIKWPGELAPQLMTFAAQAWFALGLWNLCKGGRRVHIVALCL